MLWNETDVEILWTVYEDTPTTAISLTFNPSFGTFLVFLNGLLMSQQSYRLEGRTLYIDIPLKRGDVVSCRMVV